MIENKSKLISKMARIFGNKTSLKIILSLENGKKYSFNDFKKICKACSPSVNYSIMVLKKEGVVKRVKVSKKHKKIYYELTDYGKKCLEVIKKFLSIHKNQ
ncbi:MAG: winged helix-turn-helix transcriptional regulator [Candidatus Aenigmatarchaeota archaeon]|jgi:DNA-binding HxlR family transcriptional regulator